MKKETLMKVGITLLGWVFLILVTSKISTTINPTTNLSLLEVLSVLSTTFFGWVPFYFYFKRKKTVTPEETI
jgi:hypothetical protein